MAMVASCYGILDWWKVIDGKQLNKVQRNLSGDVK